MTAGGRRLAALLMATVLATSACASLDVNKLPTPGNSYRDGYQVVMEFDNVLNLPAQAKVTLDGRTVGIVTGVAIATATSTSVRESTPIQRCRRISMPHFSKQRC